MAPQGKFKYSSALQLASNSTAWHEFIHKHLNPGWNYSEQIVHVSDDLSICLTANVFAYNQIFYYRENMPGV